MNSFRVFHWWRRPSYTYYMPHNDATNVTFTKTYEEHPQFGPTISNSWTVLPKVSNVFDAVNEISSSGFNKLLRRTSGPYRVLQVQLHAATIDDGVLLNTVSIDRITLAPKEGKVTENSLNTEETSRPLPERQKEHRAVIGTENATENHASVPKLNMAGQIMRNVDTPDSTKYIICCWLWPEAQHDRASESDTCTFYQPLLGANNAQWPIHNRMTSNGTIALIPQKGGSSYPTKSTRHSGLRIFTTTSTREMKYIHDNTPYQKRIPAQERLQNCLFYSPGVQTMMQST